MATFTIVGMLMLLFSSYLNFLIWGIWCKRRTKRRIEAKRHFIPDDAHIYTHHTSGMDGNNTRANPIYAESDDEQTSATNDTYMNPTVFDMNHVNTDTAEKENSQAVDMHTHFYPTTSEPKTSQAALVTSESRMSQPAPVTARTMPPDAQFEGAPGWACSPWFLLKYLTVVILNGRFSQVNDAVNFPSYETPVRHNLHKVAILFLLLLTGILLSPSILSNFGTSLGNNVDFCANTNITADLIVLQNQLDMDTNMAAAVQQYTWMQTMVTSMLSDTANFYACFDVGTFSNMAYRTFPTWCAAAAAQWVQAASQRTCSKRYCKWGFSLLGINCVTVDVPCAPPGLGDISNAINNYQQQQAINAQQKPVNVSDPPSTQNQQAADIINLLLYQMDIASNLYIGYVAIGLFITTPMLMLVSSAVRQLKRQFFGVQKWVFVLLVLVCWWGYRYFETVWANPQVQAYLTNLQNNPCYLDQTYISQRAQVVLNTCNTLQALSNNITNLNSSFANLYFNTNMWAQSISLGGCGCLYPGSYGGPTSRCSCTPFLWNATTDTGVYTYYPFFAYYSSGSCSAFCVYWPGCKILCNTVTLQTNLVQIGITQSSKLHPFVGNDTLCFSPEYTFQKYMVAPATNTNWFNIWLSSGIIAQLFVKVLATNFIIHCLQLVDPLHSYGNQYEAPGSSLDGQSNSIPRMSLAKEAMIITLLTHSAMKHAWFWGIILALAIFNLSWSVFRNIQPTWGNTDQGVGLLLMIIAVLVPLVSLIIYKWTKFCRFWKWVYSHSRMGCHWLCCSVCVPCWHWIGASVCIPCCRWLFFCSHLATCFPDAKWLRPEAVTSAGHSITAFPLVNQPTVVSTTTHEVVPEEKEIGD